MNLRSRLLYLILVIAFTHVIITRVLRAYEVFLSKALRTPSLDHEFLYVLYVFAEYVDILLQFRFRRPRVLDR